MPTNSSGHPSPRGGDIAAQRAQRLTKRWPTPSQRAQRLTKRWARWAALARPYGLGTASPAGTPLYRPRRRSREVANRLRTHTSPSPGAQSWAHKGTTVTPPGDAGAPRHPLGRWSGPRGVRGESHWRRRTGIAGHSRVGKGGRPGPGRISMGPTDFDGRPADIDGGLTSIDGG